MLHSQRTIPLYPRNQEEQKSRTNVDCLLLPVLGNVKGPLEFQVFLLVVVDKGGDGVIVTAGQHTGGGLLFLDCVILSAYMSKKYACDGG